jgi:sporulation related protein
MPRNYNNNSPKKSKPAARRNTRKPEAKPSARWPWLLSGFLLGAFAMFMVQRWENPEQDIAQAIDNIAGSEHTETLKPRFDFYTLLRESEVIVPDIEQSPERGHQQNGELFMLQAGSFRSTSDADSLRARLLLLNLDAQVEAASSRSAGTWYRVIVGPFNSRSKLAGARATLLQNGIDNLVLKRKEDN